MNFIKINMLNFFLHETSKSQKILPEWFDVHSVMKLIRELFVCPTRYLVVVALFAAP